MEPLPSVNVKVVTVVAFILFPTDGDDPSSPPPGCTSVFVFSFQTEFRQQLSRVMVEFCKGTRVAPRKLSLRSWGLINVLQVLSGVIIQVGRGPTGLVSV